MKISKHHLLLVTAIILFQYSVAQKQSLPHHQVKFLAGSSNNKLELLDWGGTGKPILFLTGLPNSAHIYDDFAPRFTDHFHIYALTRRGFGASFQTKSGYNTKTFTEDILAVIDSLHLSKVILIGHLIAGDEITMFASSYPGRVDKIIYLDAAYDHTKALSVYANGPTPPKFTEEDSSSFPRILKKYEKLFLGFSYPPDEYKELAKVSKEGRFLGLVTPDSILGAVIQGIELPDYIHVKCPALAIYAIPGAAKQLFPFYDTLDSLNRQKADSVFLRALNFDNEQQNQFKTQVPAGSVKVINGAHHYLFITHPDETERMIRMFLQ